MPGRKTANPSSKKLAGTFRADRHGDIVTLAVVPSAKPEAPDWLNEIAREVWDRDLPKAMALGLAAVDQSAFAIYCTSMATFIAGVKAGAQPNAAFTAELRRQLEAFGLGGLKSRLSKMASGEGDKPKEASPYSVRR